MPVRRTGEDGIGPEVLRQAPVRSHGSGMYSPALPQEPRQETGGSRVFRTTSPGQTPADLLRGVCHLGGCQGTEDSLSVQQEQEVYPRGGRNAGSSQAPGYRVSEGNRGGSVHHEEPL